MNLAEYKKEVEFYLKSNMKHSLEEINQEISEYEKVLVECYNRGFRVSATATKIAEEL